MDSSQATPSRGICTGCGKNRSLTRDGLTRSHMHNGRRCPGMCQPPEPVDSPAIEVDWGTPDLDATARLVSEAVDAIRDNLSEVFAPVIAALAAVDTEAVHAIRDRLRYGDADTAENWTGPVPTEYRASPPQSTEPSEQPTRDVSDTPITVDVAEAWLLADHDERVTTGTVRPAADRARELINQLRGPIIADIAWDLRRICRRAPGHICGPGCESGDVARFLERLAVEFDRNNREGDTR